MTDADQSKTTECQHVWWMSPSDFTCAHCGMKITPEPFKAMDELTVKELFGERCDNARPI